MKSLSGRLYVRNGRYYGRIKKSSKWIFVPLLNTDETLARAEIPVRQAEITAETSAETFAETFAETPVVTRRDRQRISQRHSQRVAEILSGYADAGFPTSRWMRKREGAEMQTSFRHLNKFFGDWAVAEIATPDLDDYVSYRTRIAAENGRGTGERVAEIDLQNLSSSLNWAVRRRLIKKNPIKTRERYQEPSTVRHCTAVMPMTADQLHDIAAAMTHSLMVQCLLEAFTGGRTSEILKLEAEAKWQTAGYYNDDYLWIDRCKGGINPYVVMHEPLRKLLEYAKAYRDKHFPHSRYLIVGRDLVNPPHHDSLTKSLKRVAAEQGLHRMTSHGLRAYYVRACRSQGLSDTEIAIRLGQRSGVRLIETTYGLPEPNWIGQNKLGFMPENETPAWERPKTK